MEQLISYKKIGGLAFPLIISQAVILLNGMIDLAFIAPFGTEAIAAVSIANALCATLFNFLEGFRIGTTVLIARAAAAKNRVSGRTVLNTGLFLAMLISILLVGSATIISHTVYDFVNNEQIRYHGFAYLTIWLWTMPFILLSYVLVGLFRGLNDTATPLYSTIAICLMNVIFSYLFVYGGPGIPSLGVKGSALGTMLANFTGFLIMCFLVLKRPLTREYINLKQAFTNQIPEYAALAADIGLNTGFTLLALLLFVGILKELGAVALAVHQITLQAFNFAYLPAVGFLITVSILLPRLLEHQQTALIVPTVNRVAKMSFGVIFLTSTLLFIFASEVSRFFSPADQIVAAQTAQTLKLVCFGQLFSSVYMVLRGALTACKDTRFIVYEGLVSGYLLFLPLAYLLAVRLNYGVYGGYIAFLLWCMTDCSALSFRFYRRKIWQKGLN